MCKPCELRLLQSQYSFRLVHTSIMPSLDLTVRATFSIPNDSFQILIFNTTSTASYPIMYYTPAVTLLPDATEIMLNPESGANCVFIELKLWDKAFVSGVQDFVIESTQDPQTVIAPIPFKWILVAYSVDRYNISIKDSSWQPIANMPPTVSVCIRCPTPAACNETKTAIQTDSAGFASHLFVSFAMQSPVSRKIPFCIDKSVLPYNAISDLIIERSAIQNYIFMRPGDYTSFVQTLIRNAVDQGLGTNEFVGANQMDKLISETYNLIPYNATTAANFTDDMWAALYWGDGERPDEKARRLQTILGHASAGLLNTVDERADVSHRNGSLRSGDSRSVAKAVDEIRSSSGGIYWNGDLLVIKPFPVFRVSLEAFLQKKPVCSGFVRIMSSLSDYAVTANAGKSFPDKKGFSPSQVCKLGAEIDRPGVTLAAVHCQSRNAESLWALSNASIMVTLRDANDQSLCQWVVTTTELSGEFTLTLPRTTGYYSVLLEARGYNPIVLRNVSHLLSFSNEVFMEPLLFIPKERGGLGVTRGTIRLLNGSRTDNGTGIEIQLRAGLYNYNGPIAATATSTNGSWSAVLPTGHYTATATVPGYNYTAPPFTVTVIGTYRSYRDWAMTPVLESSDLRIFLRGTQSYLHSQYDVKLLITGPLQGTTARGQVRTNATVSADGLMHYDFIDTVFSSVHIRKQLAGIYRIQVYEVSAMQIKSTEDWEWNLANSQSMVQIFHGDALWAQYFVPIKRGNIWTVAEIDGRRLRVVNDMQTVVPPPTSDTSIQED
ncbi:uncharacterized protein LOC129600554 isoform X2 [Paramacrobiotus metropolitanus]|uniref:uncharacterized protein LOC129600554 isoform X2 n=1 Tax=Paramacrobiotus metropolitanus TaxID=2943436 RepID=UPI00244574CE|nr:uncharacterized protein LOC129600554 isoform X2 [Paramacrobiotus metropolitanus]